MIDFMVFLGVTNPCENIAVLKTILFIKKLLNIVFILVPIGLVVMLSMDFLKNVISSKEDEMRKNLNLAIKRLVYIVALFLVPSVVDFAMISLGSFDTKYKTCFEVSADNISKQIEINKNECINGGNTWNSSALDCEVTASPPSNSNGNNKKGSSNKKITFKKSGNSTNVLEKMDSLFESYNNRLKKDRANGKHWVYTNNNNYAPQNSKFKVNAAQPKNKLGCNCATSAMWVLKDMKVIKNSTKFYGKSNGDLYVSNMKDLKKNTNIYHYPKKTVKQAIKEKKVIPGDIICTTGHTYTYMGDYIFDTGRGAHGKFVGKSLGHRSEYYSGQGVFEFHSWIMKKGTSTYKHDLSHYKAHTVIRVKKSFKVR